MACVSTCARACMCVDRAASARASPRYPDVFTVKPVRDSSLAGIEDGAVHSGSALQAAVEIVNIPTLQWSGRY